MIRVYLFAANFFRAPCLPRKTSQTHVACKREHVWDYFQLVIDRFEARTFHDQISMLQWLDQGNLTDTLWDKKSDVRGLFKDNDSDYTGTHTYTKNNLKGTVWVCNRQTDQNLHKRQTLQHVRTMTYGHRGRNMIPLPWWGCKEGEVPFHRWQSKQGKNYQGQDGQTPQRKAALLGWFGVHQPARYNV